ncbi:MAG: hypothetical protein LBV34_20055 [Nocardiopsaceae bacterium]|jgi:hypothetical protein|nr:hypothetical protein [Nocardiopsaceae bacterium]
MRGQVSGDLRSGHLRAKSPGSGANGADGGDDRAGVEVEQVEEEVVK